MSELYKQILERPVTQTHLQEDRRRQIACLTRRIAMLDTVLEKEGSFSIETHRGSLLLNQEFSQMLKGGRKGLEREVQV